MTKAELKNDPKSDKRKQSVYFPVDMLDEIQKEALRQDRTVSWIVQRAWKIARDEILLYPSINDPTGDEASSPAIREDEASF
ncbi:MAG: TIGR04563 family protein [Proteobacteria bacterium]|nr:TIGR04563 family protein [Pseudomonadota bacterium]